MTTETSALKPIPRLSGGVPLLGHLLELRSDRYGILFRTLRECGGIGMLRAGPLDILVLSDHALIQKLMVDHGDDVHRGPYFETFTPILGPNSLLTNSGAKHRRHRKLHVPVFGHRRMAHYSSTMVECITKVVDSLKDGAEVDMGLETGRMARLIIAKTFFTLEEGPTADQFQECINIIDEAMTHMTVTPIPLWIPTANNRRTRKAITMLRNRAREIMEEHQARTKGQDIGDLLSMLRESRNEDDGSKLTTDEMVDHVVTMYMAGQETTAGALAWMCIHMAQHPEIQRKLQSEADEVLQGRVPTYEDLPKMPYNLKFTKECLRLSSPAAVIGRESLKEFQLGDYLIPAKQFILISLVTMHYAPEMYPEPERVDPERFTPEREKARPRSAFLPFGTGAHTCIGNHFAMLELQLALAYMVQRLHLELVPGQNIQPKLYVTLKPSSARFIVKTRAAAPAAHALKA